MPIIYYSNDYFLDFRPVPGELEVSHQDIPEGYHIFLYKKVCIPTDEHYATFSRGSGTNPDTMDVPIYYASTPGGRRNAIQFCQKMSEARKKSSHGNH